MGRGRSQPGGPGELPAAPCVQCEPSCLLRAQSGKAVTIGPLLGPLLALGQRVTRKGVTPPPRVHLVWHDESVSKGRRLSVRSLRGHCCGVPQTYIRSVDKDFVAATIQAIGRCATNIGRVRDTCLNGLVQLLSNRDGQCLSV